MWSTGALADRPTWFARLKEMGCTAEEIGRGEDAAEHVRGGLGFYVENLVSDLGFLNNRHNLYDADYKGYTSTRDKKFLIRKPCFDDPAFWTEQERVLPPMIRHYRDQHPLLYNLRDELSIGSFASPMDYCFCPHTLHAFRNWLKQRYGSLEALNAEWETHFPAWDDVTPLTTYEAKDRERAALAAGRPENYAPWADHREYMDLSFAKTLDRLRGMIHQIDTETPVGIEGTQMPSAWGGYDLWRLSHAVDWVEPYDIANSREVFRSFLPERSPVMGTVFGGDFPHLQAHLWRLLLHGDRGCLIWDDEKSRCIEKDAPAMPLTARGKGMVPILAELKRVAPELMNLRRVDDRIAIHYSQASIRAQWMFESREDKDTWPRRFSSYEASHSRFARVRDSFVRAVEDLGLQYKFLAYEQMEKGELLTGKYRVLLLPQSVAMSAAECQAVRAFAQSGGTVIADNMTATMDEHGKRLPTGQLDDLFGIRRSATGWRQEPAAGTLTAQSPTADPLQVFEPEIALTTGKALRMGGRAPAVVENRLGKGRAVYLNLDMSRYGRQRLQGNGAEMLALFQKLLADGGVTPALQVVGAADGRAVPCVEVWRYQSAGADYVAVMRNPEFAADSLGEVGYKGNTALEKTEKVRVLLPAAGQVSNVRTGARLGMARQVEAELEPWSPLILRLERGAQ